MATTKVLNDEVRARHMAMVSDFLKAHDVEFVVTGSNEFALPTLDAEHNEKWVVLTFKVPTGSRDGEEYDGYEVAADYERHLAEKAEKAKAAAEAKARKIERDKAMRKAKAEKGE